MQDFQKPFYIPCCNSSRTHKLPLLVIEKTYNLRAFRNANLSVVYKTINRGWITEPLFL